MEMAAARLFSAALASFRFQPSFAARLLIAVWLMPCFWAILETEVLPARYSRSIAGQFAVDRGVPVMGGMI